MSRFLWQVRREVWEHKAIWVAPLIVIGCLALSVLVSRLHLGPDIEIDSLAPLAGLSDAELARLVMIAYAGLTVVVFAVMGIIAFFYAIDALYADRRDRSVLFWKSLPLSDAESVLSKFAVATVLIPLLAAAAAVLAQFVVAAVASAKLAMTGMDAAGLLWHPEAVLGGLVIALLAGVTAAFWYAPVLAYLMLASSWAPRAPFLWAVLPPVALILIERLLFYTNHVGDFVGERLFGIARVLDQGGPDVDPQTNAEVQAEVARVLDMNLVGNLLDFFRSPDLWLGVAAAGLLLAAAIWVRRYRDETT